MQGKSYPSSRASHGGALDVFLDGAESKVGDALPIVFAEEKTRPDQPKPNARTDESEDAGEFRLIPLAALVRMKLAAFRDKDRVHLRDLVSVGLVSVGLVDKSWLPGLSTPPARTSRSHPLLARRMIRPSFPRWQRGRKPGPEPQRANFKK